MAQKCTLAPSVVPVTERSLPGMGRSTGQDGHLGRGGRALGAPRLRVSVIDSSAQGTRGCQPRHSWQPPVLTRAFLPHADKLTEDEFIERTLANKEILRLIQYEPQKVKERLKEQEKNA